MLLHVNSGFYYDFLGILDVAGCLMKQMEQETIILTTPTYPWPSRFQKLSEHAKSGMGLPRFEVYQHAHLMQQCQCWTPKMLDMLVSDFYGPNYVLQHRWTPSTQAPTLTLQSNYHNLTLFRQIGPWHPVLRVDFLTLQPQNPTCQRIGIAHKSWSFL